VVCKNVTIGIYMQYRQTEFVLDYTQFLQECKTVGTTMSERRTAAKY